MRNRRGCSGRYAINLRCENTAHFRRIFMHLALKFEMRSSAMADHFLLKILFIHPHTTQEIALTVQPRHDAHLSTQLTETIIVTLTLITSQFEASHRSVIR